MTRFFNTVLARRVRLAGLSVLMGVVFSCSAFAQPLGLKIGIQPWEPITDRDDVITLLDDPSLISDAADAAWNGIPDVNLAKLAKAAADAVDPSVSVPIPEALRKIGWEGRSRQQLTDALAEALGKGDLLANGFTLRDITVLLNKPDISVEQFSGRGTPEDPVHIVLRVNILNSGLDFRMTTPDIVAGVGIGSAADPHCKVTFDATAVLDLFISNDWSNPVSSPQAFGTSKKDPPPAPILKITRISAQAENVSCGIPVLLINTVKGVAEITGLEHALNALIQLGFDEMNGAMNVFANSTMTNVVASANSRVADAMARYRETYADWQGLVTSKMPMAGQDTVMDIGQVLFDLLLSTHLQAWYDVEPKSARITLLVAPTPVRDRSQRAEIGGPIEVLTGKVPSSKPLTIDCSRLPVRVSVKTGPPPVLNSNFALGPSERMPVGVSTRCTPKNVLTPDAKPGDRSIMNKDGSIRPRSDYVVEGLSSIFPNMVDISEAGCRTGDKIAQGISLFRDAAGWPNGSRIGALDRFRAFPLKAVYDRVPCGEASRRNISRNDVVVPRVNPAERVIRTPSEARVNQPGIDIPARRIDPSIKTTTRIDEAEANRCRTYADDAVAGIRDGIDAGCDLAGPRFADDPDAHFNWCMTVGSHQTGPEAKARGREIRRCLALAKAPEPPRTEELPRNDEADACDAYARTAVEQIGRAREAGCDLQGDRFAPNYEAHFGWCMSVGAQNADGETRARAKDIKRCDAARSAPADAPADDNVGISQAYARDAVADVEQAVASNCPLDGPRFTPNFDDHFGWCMSVGPAKTGGEAQARKNDLAACLAAVPPVLK